MALPLVALDVLALVLWAVALALAAALIMKELGSVLAGIPVVGGYLARAANAMAQQLTNAAGLMERGIDKLIGASWHALARVSDLIWREIRAHSGVLALYGGILGQMVNILLHLRVVANHAAKTVGNHDTTIKHLEHELHGIAADVRTLDHEVAKGIGEDVLPRIKSLDKELAHVTQKVIPGVRDIANTAESDVTALQAWITRNVPLASTATFAGVVAYALSSLGLGGLRCNNFTNLLNKWGCGLGRLLDGLLGLVISALALENVCRLLPILEDAFGEVVGPVTHLLTEVPLGGCETPPDSWAQLTVTAGPRPPQQALGSFPS